MSIFDAKKLTEEYLDEIKKQTDSYGFFCQNEQVKRGELLNGSCPPFCVVSNLHEVIFGNNSEDSQEKAVTDKKYIFIKDDNSQYEIDELSSLLVSDRKIDLMYWDHDVITEGKRHAPFFKPDYSVDTLLNCNYIGDSYVVSTEVAMSVIDSIRNEWCDRELNDIDNNVIAGENILERRAEKELRYDFLLRVCEVAKSIIHEPVVIEHIVDETVDDYEIYAEYTWKNQSQKYINIRNEAFKRRKLAVSYEKVFERKNNSVINNNVINNIVIKHDKTDMELSIIIPSKDHSDILITCLKSIREHFEISDRKKLEIIVVDNGSAKEEKKKIEDFLAEYKNSIPIEYIYESFDFNYSTMCNMGAKKAQYKYLLFLNDDIEVIDENTFERMYAYATLDHVGAVGAKLYYPDGNIIQHTGVTVDLDCGPTHKLATYTDDKPYYYGINVFNKNTLAVTGACLLVNREKYFKNGGFNDKMGVSYNDVDLCVKLHESGYSNIVLNECILFHHESLSRGMDHVDDNKYLRLKDERSLLYKEHPWILNEGDPFYSKNLISDTLGYTVDVMADYSLRSSRSNILENDAVVKKLETDLKQENKAGKKGIKTKGRNRIGRKRIHFNVESTSFERGIMANEEDYYLIDGWAIVQRRDNAMYDTQLVLISEDGACLKFDTFRKNREDVAVVFVNEKNTCLSGFVCKIPAGIIDKNKKYRLAIIRKSRLTGINYRILGDYYEPARGYHTAEV